MVGQIAAWLCLPVAPCCHSATLFAKTNLAQTLPLIKFATVIITIHQRMDKHALAILSAGEWWSWPLTLRIQKSGKKVQDDDKYKATTRKLLSGFIAESVALGGTLLGRFWLKVGECHPKLIENSGLKFFSYERIPKLNSLCS